MSYINWCRTLKEGIYPTNALYALTDLGVRWTHVRNATFSQVAYQLMPSQVSNRILPKYLNCNAWATSVDPDQTPQIAASD